MAEPYFDEAIQAATDCAKACSPCLVACLQHPEVARLRETILLNLDCIDVCRAVFALLSRTSEHSRELLSYSYELFRQCAEECGKHKDVPEAVRCSQSCHHLSTLARRFEKDFVPGFLH